MNKGKFISIIGLFIAFASTCLKNEVLFTIQFFVGFAITAYGCALNFKDK